MKNLSTKLLFFLIIKVNAQTIIDVNLNQVWIGSVNGPEAIAFNEQGFMYTTNEDGRIIVIPNNGSQPYDFVQTGGRPLGLKFDAQSNLIVADAYEGLLSIDISGNITTLSTEYGGVPFLLTDDLDIASNGIIYFSDASSVNNLENSSNDWGQPNGRLLAYNPSTSETILLLDGLYFANGVALGPDENFLLVNETSLGHIRRYWLTGPNVGQTDIFSNIYENIGWVFPDNITFNGDSIFWCATFNGPVLALDTTGHIIYQLNFDNSLINENTSVIQYDNILYLGSLHETHLGIIQIPEEILSSYKDDMFKGLTPNIYNVNQNYPNPFNPVTTIEYELLKNGFVNVTVYDMLGNIINQLVNDVQNSGHKSVQWNATNNQGQPVSAGVYLYSIKVGNFKQTRKMLLLK